MWRSLNCTTRKPESAPGKTSELYLHVLHAGLTERARSPHAGEAEREHADDAGDAPRHESSDARDPAVPR